jgi:uncharacterized protein YegP (UPF0339 family)
VIAVRCKLDFARPPQSRVVIVVAVLLNTRQADQGDAMRFSVGNTTGDKPSWWLYDDNAEMVAWAGETFASMSNAQRAAESFKAGASTARYDIYLDDGQKYRWRAWRSSDKVAASGESFASTSNAERAAENVRDNTGNVTGP